MQMRDLIFAAGSVLVMGIAAAGVTPAFADETTEARLREALKNANARVQTLEEENAALRVKTPPQAPPAQPKKASDSKAIAGLRGRLSEADAAIQKWKAAYDEAAAALRQKDAEIKKAVTETGAIKERSASCEAKNAKLFEVAKEILDRYEHIGFGDALSAKEPFVGTKRVEMQNLAQDYQDKLLDNKVTP